MCLQEIQTKSRELGVEPDEIKRKGGQGEDEKGRDETTEEQR